MKLTKTQKINIYIIIIGSIFVSLSAFHTNTWFDEAFTISLANRNISQIWQICANDVHPALYYYMIRIILLMFNNSIIAGRIFSTVGIIIFGILGYTHIRKDFGEKVGALFSFFAYFLPIQAVCAVEIRMYSWSLLFATLALIYAYRIAKNSKNKDWIIFTILCVACMYIHYYALIIAFLVNLVLLIYFLKNKNKVAIKKQIMVGIILILAYIPWIKNCISQLQYVSKGYWIIFKFPYTLMELTSCQLIGRLNYNIGFIASIMLYIYLLYRIKKEKNKKVIYYCIGIYIGVILIALLFSLGLNTLILYYRYLTILSGIYIFILSFLLAKENNKKIIIFICSVILILGIANNIKLIEENYDTSNDACVQYLKDNVKEDDIFVYSDIDNASKIIINFENYHHFFYHKENWGVEQIYKAFEPQMQIIWGDKTFLDNYAGRIWIINARIDDIFFELFNNEKYEYIERKEFKEKYRNAYYSVILVNKK